MILAARHDRDNILILETYYLVILRVILNLNFGCELQLNCIELLMGINSLSIFVAYVHNGNLLFKASNIIYYLMIMIIINI